jgi:release factor glutamine methyltransferase
MGVSFGALRIALAPTVYEPAEDSFLLAAYASGITGGKRVLEIGCGCGIASLSAAKADSANEVVGVDINPAAVECSRHNAWRNGAKNASFLRSDLFSAVLASEFDYILFNPPYLPTTRREKLRLEAENAAYDGGRSGLQTFMRFAAEARKHLACGGRAAVIATSLNGGAQKALAELGRRVGPARILAEEAFFFEKICLIESVRE